MWDRLFCWLIVKIQFDNAKWPIMARRIAASVHLDAMRLIVIAEALRGIAGHLRRIADREIEEDQSE